MSRNPTLKEIEAVKMAESRARLVLRNKEAARAQLLAIQLLLAKRVSTVSPAK
jgi:hypothetical protein